MQQEQFNTERFLLVGKERFVIANSDNVKLHFLFTG